MSLESRKRKKIHFGNILSKLWASISQLRTLVDTPEKGGLTLKWMVATFFITLQFNCIYCVCRGKVKFALLHFDSSVFWVKPCKILIQVFLVYTVTLYDLCISASFLIVYRKCWLLYLFKWIWNTQKITWISTKVCEWYGFIFLENVTCRIWPCLFRSEFIKWHSVHSKFEFNS